MISGKAKVCGLIACPVEHSLSPLMHNFFAEEMGIDLAYVPFLVKSSSLKEAVCGAYALNLAGLNVTVPHKQAIIPFLAGIDEASGAIGAVNTLVRVEGGFWGYNTDAPGLLRAVKEAGIRVKGQDCLLIGAGGAAKAAAFMLGSEGAASVTVLNRSVDRAWQLAEEMNRHFGRTFMAGMALTDYEKLPDGRWLAVQTTSVGMSPHKDEVPVEDREFYRSIDIGIDVIYTPAKTRFMASVEEAGGKAVGGLDMLIYQGIQAFEMWNPGRKVPPETADKVKALMRRRLER